MAGFNQIATSVTIINSGLIGYQGISLTDFSLTTVSAIAAGSGIEIAGAFFKAENDITVNASSWTAITTATTAYIALTPSGTAGSQILTAAWVSTAPIWSTSKQGWYTTTSSNIRCVASTYKNGTSSYTKKTILQPLHNTNWNSILNTDLGANWVTALLINLGAGWLTQLQENYVFRGTEERITSGSGNWTVPAGVYRIRVKCIGGGGGGAGGYYNTTNSIFFSGGGGGGTSISAVPWSVITTIPGSNIAYSVGTGGTGGTGGISSVGGNGNNTTFTGATTGTGGSGGAGSAAGTGATGGYGSDGNAGQHTIDSTGPYAYGGSGGGSGGAGTTTNGVTGNYGGGGGGGGCNSGNNYNGGAGGSGIIIIEY